MLRLLLSIASGIIIGVAGTLITLNWQEEKLRFELGSPAAFGEIVYQNLSLTNDGWNLATNVKLFLRHPAVSARNVQSTPVFNLSTEEPHLLGGYDRLRRSEAVIVTFAFKGTPIEARALSIKSDRSVAQPQARDGSSIDALSLLIGAQVDQTKTTAVMSTLQRPVMTKYHGTAGLHSNPSTPMARPKPGLYIWPHAPNASHDPRQIR